MHGREIEDRARGFRIAIEPRVALTVAIVLGVGVLIAWAIMRGPETAPVSVPAAQPSPSVSPSSAESFVGAPVTALVHVSGAVDAPGLVEVDSGARVADVLETAGGALPDADLSAVNLARPVVDGEQVHVPAVGEVQDSSGPVRLNQATAAQLEELPGVGPVLAERIVSDRDANGPFSSLADLARVSGVGEALVAGLEEVADV